MRYKRIALGAAIAAVVAGGSIAAIGMANASTTPASIRRSAVEPSIRRGITPVATNPYIVAPPGATLDDGDSDTLQVAGRTFGGVTVPGNANGATVTVSSVNPSGSGHLTVYTPGRRPGNSTVSFRRGQNVSGTETVSFDSRGRLSVYSSEHTRYTLRLLSFSTPDTVPPPPSCTETISTIPASAHTLTNVGGSIRTGATDFGNVTLPAGTYDARVIGGFTGANNNDTWYTNNLFLTGTMVLVKGAAIAPDFSNDVTTGGVLIPKSNSTTLTQDPTLAISTFLVLAAPTDVHVKLFAYASDSGTAGSGQLKGNLQSAQFRKLC